MTINKRTPINILFIFGTIVILCFSGCNKQIRKDVANGKIVFLSNQDGVTNFYSIKTDGSELQKLTNYVTNNSVSEIIGNLDPSPDGKYILYETNIDGNSEIYLFNLEKGNSTNLTNNKASDFYPVWSPDGKQIAFISDRDAILLNLERDIWTNNIYVMDADGNNLYRLTKGNTIAGFSGLSWSPKGKRFLLGMITVSPYGGIFSNGINILNMEDLKLTQLDPDFNSLICCHKWSRDGNQIVFSKKNGRFANIYVMNNDGTNQIELKSNSFSIDTHPYWSPDGEYIVFSSNQGNGYHIYIMNKDGTSPHRVTKMSGEETEPIWLPEK